MKIYLADGAAGLPLAAMLFFLAPLLFSGGNWGAPAGGAFPYFLLAVFLFFLYSRTSFYRRRHAAGAKPFSAALAAFVAGALAGYGAVLLAAAFSVTQWTLAL